MKPTAGPWPFPCKAWTDSFRGVLCLKWQIIACRQTLENIVPLFSTLMSPVRPAFQTCRLMFICNSCLSVFMVWRNMDKREIDRKGSWCITNASHRANTQRHSKIHWHLYMFFMCSSQSTRRKSCLRIQEPIFCKAAADCWSAWSRPFWYVVSLNLHRNNRLISQIALIMWSYIEFPRSNLRIQMALNDTKCIMHAVLMTMANSCDMQNKNLTKLDKLFLSGNMSFCTCCWLSQIWMEQWKREFYMYCMHHARANKCIICDQSGSQILILPWLYSLPLL